MGSDLEATFPLFEAKQNASETHNGPSSMPGCQREYFKPADLHRITREAPEGCTLIFHSSVHISQTTKAKKGQSFIGEAFPPLAKAEWQVTPPDYFIEEGLNAYYHWLPSEAVKTDSQPGQSISVIPKLEHATQKVPTLIISHQNLVRNLHFLRSEMPLTREGCQWSILAFYPWSEFRKIKLFNITEDVSEAPCEGVFQVDNEHFDELLPDRLDLPSEDKPVDQIEAKTSATTETKTPEQPEPIAQPQKAAKTEKSSNPVENKPQDFTPLEEPENERTSSDHWNLTAKPSSFKGRLTPLLTLFIRLMDVETLKHFNKRLHDQEKEKNATSI